jgi:hypothetical protein
MSMNRILEESSFDAFSVVEDVTKSVTQLPTNAKANFVDNARSANLESGH